MQFPNQPTQDFINKHQHDNLQKLLLKKRNNNEVDYEFALRQIAGRQRIKNKLPEFYKNESIIFPQQLNLEQSSSESTALYKKNICEGNVFIDITGGFGIDFYYISEKFEQAIYVDRDKELTEIVEGNLNRCGRKNAKIICKDALDFINEMPDCSCVMVDPARRDNSGGKVVFLSDCEPDITQIYRQILAKTNMLVVKLSPMLDISAALGELKMVSEVHVISVENECKEILLIFRKKLSVDKTVFSAVNISKNNDIETFRFTKEEEHDTPLIISEAVMDYLYEPNSSVLKAGAFKSVAQRYGLAKLHINTHLYTSDQLLSDFPGRVFKVNQVWTSDKHSFKRMSVFIKKANISTRNYPLKPDEIKKKTGITDGGDTYLFGCTLKNESKVLIECTKITSKV